MIDEKRQANRTAATYVKQFLPKKKLPSSDINDQDIQKLKDAYVMKHQHPSFEKRYKDMAIR